MCICFISLVLTDPNERAHQESKAELRTATTKDASLEQQLQTLKITTTLPNFSAQRHALFSKYVPERVLVVAIASR